MAFNKECNLFSTNSHPHSLTSYGIWAKEWPLIWNQQLPHWKWMHGHRARSYLYQSLALFLSTAFLRMRPSSLFFLYVSLSFPNLFFISACLRFSQSGCKESRWHWSTTLVKWLSLMRKDIQRGRGRGPDKSQMIPYMWKTTKHSILKVQNLFYNKL